MIEALQITLQTGAVDLLLRIPGHVLLNYPIKICATVTTLKEKFPELTATEVENILQHEGLAEEFIGIAQGSATIVLEGDTPTFESFYFERFISNRLYLDPRVFKENCPDVFVFKGFHRNDLLDLVDPHVIRSSRELLKLSSISSRHIDLMGEETWDDLVELWEETPVHLISKDGDYYVLERTNSKVTDIIIKHVLKNITQKDTYMSENQLIDQLMSVRGSRCALLCDVPGMGKSWLMKSLAKKLQKKTGESVVFFVQLASFAKGLVEQRSRNTEFSGLYDMLQYTCRTKLAAHLLLELFKTQNLGFIFILDGFDEISDLYRERTESTLKVLNNHEKVRLVISSRPHFRKRLEEKFELVSYDILEFTKNEEIETMIGHWKRAISNNDVRKLTNLAERCLQEFKNVQRNDTCDILGVPLKCHMLAVVYEKFARNICRFKIEPDKEANVVSIANLYEQFIEYSVSKLVENENARSSTDMRQKIMLFHTLKALELQHKEVAEEFGRIFCGDLDPFVEEWVSRVGLLLYTSNNEFEFKHQSYADYFVGKFFAEYWMNMETYENGYIKTVAVYFIKQVMVTSYEHLNRMLHQVKFENYLSPLRSKSFKFNNSIMLSFVDSIYKNQSKHQNFSILNDIGTFSQCEDYLKRKSYGILIACIEEGFTVLLSLFKKVTRSLIGENEIHTLISSPDGQMGRKLQIASVPLLLYFVALKGSLEASGEIFSIFGETEQNHLIKYCEKYPDEYWSPLEVAILRNNLDMVAFFMKRVGLPQERRLVAYLIGTNMTQYDIDERVKILEYTFQKKDANLRFLQRNNLVQRMHDTDERYDINVSILINFAWKRNICLNFATEQNKLLFLRLCLPQSNDHEIIKLLILLFGEDSDKTLRVLKCWDETESEPLAWRNLRAENVLDVLDIIHASGIFSKLDLKYVKDSFENVLHVETLRVLNGLCTDFSICNLDEWNFVHLAVMQGKVEWVKHLIESDYDINRRDSAGNTPLLCISSRKPVEVAKLLFEKVLDVYAVNDREDNVAHVLCRAWKCIDLTDMVEFAALTIEKYANLWTMTNTDGLTPFEILQKLAGESNAKVVQIQIALKSEKGTTTLAATA